MAKAAVAAMLVRKKERRVTGRRLFMAPVYSPRLEKSTSLSGAQDNRDLRFTICEDDDEDEHQTEDDRDGSGGFIRAVGADVQPVLLETAH